MTKIAVETSRQSESVLFLDVTIATGTAEQGGESVKFELTHTGGSLVLYLTRASGERVIETISLGNLLTPWVKSIIEQSVPATSSPTARTRRAYADEARLARSNPGEWFKLDPSVTTNAAYLTASRMRRGAYAEFAPSGSFESHVDEVGAVNYRYIGGGDG